ncbi:hypothetical protein PAXRUDRAFT_799035, partial [Paxillus rubicundulus Ve08.2h10]
MSPHAICKTVKTIDDRFKTLQPQVVGRWIDCSGMKPKWHDTVIAHVNQGHVPSSTTTQHNILSPYPQVVQAIVEQLRTLCLASIAHNASRCCGIIVAQLQHHVSQIFSTKSPDGSMF